MPYINLNAVGPPDRVTSASLNDGISFAHNSVQFAALAIRAGEQDWFYPKIHLYALAIELGLKSLALRSGATLAQCKKASHDPCAMIELIERNGSSVPERLKTRLSDKEWFQAFLFMSRYPALSELNSSFDKTIFLHSDYPEMIAGILEAPCKWPLTFDRGSALEEIKNPSLSTKFFVYTDRHGA